MKQQEPKKETTASAVVRVEDYDSQSLRAAVSDMVSRPPEAGGLTKLEDIAAAALDEADEAMGWEGTQMQDSLRQWSSALLKNQSCGCGYEDVEDGAVTRRRWFHEPDCAGSNG